jgi:2-octaprenyl-6-methoxyphenol hydroxylase
VRQIVGTVDARDGRTLFLSDGSEIIAPLIVGADGARSKMRELAGIGVRHWTYPQSGIVCTVRHARSHHNVAHEHFLPAGPFAILPLADNRASLVWTERATLAPALIALPPDEFLAELATRFGDFLGDLALEGPIWSYPLSLHLAERAIDMRLALIGDAAHGMHPIAGQGFNLGLRDVAALAETVVDAARLGLDIGAGTVLRRYADWRRLDTLAMLGITDLLNRLFSNDVPPVRLARDLGLAAVNRVPPLKRFLMHHAMGMSATMTGGTLPRLLKGEAL